MLTRVNGPDPRPKPSTESSFKTIIIIFSLGSILESSFKIMIIIIFILKLIQVNDQPELTLGWVLKLYYNHFYCSRYQTLSKFMSGKEFEQIK
jgi:hypothetical protein